MIKHLIEDLAYDKITLSQGLTRAKLIAGRTQASNLREWVNQELQGYKDDLHLPDYRVIPCQTYLVIRLPFGGQDVVPVYMGKDSLSKYYDTHQLYDSVNIIESLLSSLKDELVITLSLPANLTLPMAKPFEQDIQDRMGAVRSVIKKISRSQYERVVDLTKHKLLDTLLELYAQFPNLENDFNPTEENLNKVENIVNNHIWGNNNPITVAAGQNVVQKDITNNVGLTDYSKLEALGVEKAEVEELQTILTTHQGDKQVLKEKVMKWVMPVMTGAMARGLYEQAPKIMEFVTKLIE
ncbi:hypothetical protein J2I47_20965 [Fibrella sp. HMF5335]|uniref:AbiTii domain-containing protein n=1 Tax=Fibrella rubiginis TaxID=2817060 RepID=A0A939K6N7_9BACT|nr:hypothetical protein [Fibrella rubiginis]MBO0939038.1 hypothetical protein [Fibrella rubiginis]